MTPKGIGLTSELHGYLVAHGSPPDAVQQSLIAHTLKKLDVDYVVRDGEGGKKEVVIVDEFTGRLMPGRRWSDGLHQAVEAKEGIQVRSENQTLASITFQNYFRMYEKLSGMTGTADTEAAEFASICDLDVVMIPKVEGPEDIHYVDRLLAQLEAKAGLDRPILVLHAMRDYQVTENDLNAWIAGLQGREHATVLEYGVLNHLFMEGRGRATPAEYAIAGHVADTVIRDIADWVLQRRSR